MTRVALADALVLEGKRPKSFCHSMAASVRSSGPGTVGISGPALWRPAILGPVAFGPDVFLSETMDNFSIVVDIVGGIADRVDEGGIAVVGVFETGIDDNWSGNSAGGGPVLSFSM